MTDCLRDVPTPRETVPDYEGPPVWIFQEAFETSRKCLVKPGIDCTYVLVIGTAIWGGPSAAVVIVLVLNLGVYGPRNVGEPTAAGLCDY
jgi:hypothetical protein